MVTEKEYAHYACIKATVTVSASVV